MKYIILSGKYANGRFAVVSDKDFDRLSKYRWRIYKAFGGEYAKRTVKVRSRLDATRTTTTVAMHRDVVRAKIGETVDHINRNTLDNQRENLRVCSMGDNLRNGKLRKNVSGYRGVYSCAKTHPSTPWEVKVRHNYKSIWLGRYASKQEAATVYNNATKKLFGEFAYQNPL